MSDSMPATFLPNMAGERAGREYRCKRLREAARDLLAAYDEYIDTDLLDPLAEAIGKLREAL